MDLWEDLVGQNWSWYSHEKLYRMVRTDAPGPSGMADTNQAWAEITTLMVESRQTIDRLLRQAGASWEGLAAEAMQGSVTPLAQWADDTATASTATGNSVRNVVESFSFTANQMPEPVPVTSTANSGIPSVFTHLFGGQTDQDQQERAAQEARLRAVELMTNYSSSASDAVSNVGVFVPPQDVTVGVRPPQGTTGSVTSTQGAVVTPPPPITGGAVEPGTRSTPSPPQPTQPQTQPVPTGPPPARPPTDPQPTETRPAATIPPAATTPAAAPAADPSGSGEGFTPPRGPSFGSVHETRQPLSSTRGAPPARPLSTSDSSHLVTRPAGEAAVRAAGLGGPFVPGVGAQGARGEEDDEHRSPDYLQAYHDEYWEGGLRVSPPVLGEDEG